MQETPIEMRLDIVESLARLSSWQWDLKNKQFVSSRNLADFLGLRVDEPLSYEAVFRFLDTAQQAEFDLLWQNCLQSKSPLEYRGILRSEDDQPYHVEIIAEVICSTDGQVLGLAGAIQDVSRRTGTLLALQRSEERLRAIFEGSNHGILLLALDGTIFQCNQAFAELIDQERSGILGSRLQSYIHPDDKPRYISKLEALFDETEIENIALPLRCMRPNSEIRWADFSISIVRNKDGAANRLIALLEDISGRRSIEQALAKARNQLARSRDKAQQFLAQELHDRPIQDLHAARFQLQALRPYLTDARGEELLDLTLSLFQQSINSLRTIMGELRPPALAPFGLAAAIRSHVEHFLALYPHLQIKLRLEEDGQRLTEETRFGLYRITQELMNNVAKHAQAKTIWISLQINKTETILTVRDNGVGFTPPRHLFQLASAGHLGLLGSEERVKDLDGEMSLRSALSQGTEVRVTIPHEFGEY